MNTRSPFFLIILLGVVSLFADLTYEGARSIIGPYLATLGASATLVGFVAGFGEFLGYLLRFLSGYFADKLKRYWALTFIGYFINLLSVPALYFAKTPFQAVSLILLERIGKAVRSPARDTILSYATAKIGRGIGFGIHEAMDQIGALAGPLFISLILFYTQKDYKTAFAFLLIPALMALFILVGSALLYPEPSKYEAEDKSLKKEGLTRAFYFYAISMGIYGAGYIDFALIAYHFEKKRIFEASFIPLTYALAMGVDAFSSLIFGYLLDKKGLKILFVSISISSVFSLFVFLGDFKLALLGMVLWGIGMGAQESVMRASISFFVPKTIRATGYGIFNAIFGFFWFLGSFLMGRLYEVSLYALVIVSIVLQWSSLVLLRKALKS
jgi:MFS family permease